LAPVAAAVRLFATGLSILAPIVPPRWVRLNRPIFIVGCSPSGTRLVADILERHADVASWPAMRQRRGERALEGADIGPPGLKRLRLAMRLNTVLLGRRHALAVASGRVSQLDQLDAIFPGCLVLHVVRDARPEILGNALAARRRRPLTAAAARDPQEAERELALISAQAERWSEIAGRIQDLGATLLGQTRYAEIRVEEFRAHPEYQLSRLDAFCGLDPAQRDRSTIASIARDADDEPSEALTAEAAEKIRAVAGARMTRLGYRLD
jgi:hypothetical protein